VVRHNVSRSGHRAIPRRERLTVTSELTRNRPPGPNPVLLQPIYKDAVIRSSLRGMTLKSSQRIAPSPQKLKLMLFRLRPVSG
jgi:hypothetical protein